MKNLPNSSKRFSLIDTPKRYINSTSKLPCLKAALFITIGVSLAMLSKATFTSESAYNECDVLTAVPNNTDNPAGIITVQVEDINAELAVPACEKAVKDYPNELRYVYQLGVAYQKKEGYLKAVQFYRQAAKQGYATAQNHLGKLYEYGQGVEESNVKAFEWYVKAAEQGNIEGQQNLGYMYHSGTGTKESLSKAMAWYRKSAEQGSNDAQNILDMLEGEVASFESYLKFAEQGDAQAHYYIALMYKRGEGTNQSDDKAYEWFSKAAKLGHEESRIIFEQINKERNDFITNLKSAEQGDAQAQMNLASQYYYGRGIKESKTKAFEWYQKAANQGHSDSQYHLGTLYQAGYGTEVSMSKALEWYLKANEQGHSGAQTEIGLLYNEGDGVEQSYTEAVKWFRKAANKGFPRAQFGLGLKYRDGKGVPQSYTKSIEWFKKANEHDSIDAEIQIATVYENSKDIEHSKAQAIQWYRKAAEKGEAYAIYKLEQLEE